MAQRKSPPPRALLGTGSADRVDGPLSYIEQDLLDAADILRRVAGDLRPHVERAIRLNDVRQEVWELPAREHARATARLLGIVATRLDGEADYYRALAREQVTVNGRGEIVPWDSTRGQARAERDLI